MTTKTLAARVAEAMEMDAKRTKGDWSVETFNRDPIRSEYHPVDVLLGKARLRIGNNAKSDANAAFIAAGPAHIALIRDLFAALERAEKDAARYRWIRKRLPHSVVHGYGISDTAEIICLAQDFPDLSKPMQDSMDSTIDAAIAKEPSNDR